MSLIVAVRDDQDLVAACDGRVLGPDSAVMSDEAWKTMALNRELCLGVAGPTDAIRAVLTSLGLNCRGTHPVDLLRACEEARCPIDVGYRDAQNELTAVLRWMKRRSPLSSWSARLPALLLAGRAGGMPTLSGWSPPTWAEDESPSSGYSRMVLGQLPGDDSPARAAFQTIVDEEPSVRGAEERLARGVRFCARYFGPTGPVSGTVFLRRLSDGLRMLRAE